MKQWLAILSITGFSLWPSDLRADLVTIRVTKASQEQAHIDRFRVRIEQVPDSFACVSVAVPKKHRAGMDVARLSFGEGEGEDLWLNMAVTEEEDGSAVCGFDVQPNLLAKCRVQLFFHDAPPNGTIYLIDVSSYVEQRPQGEEAHPNETESRLSGQQAKTVDHIESATTVSDTETTEAARFVEMARAAFAKASKGGSLSPEQLAVPDALGKDWKLYSSEAYGGAESGIHELLYAAQEPMLALSKRDEIVLQIKVFSTVPAAREWALQRALAGAAPTAHLVNLAKIHFGKAGLPGDFCFRPGLFVRGNLVVEYGNDVTPVVSEHVDASLLDCAASAVSYTPLPTIVKDAAWIIKGKIISANRKDTPATNRIEYVIAPTAALMGLPTVPQKVMLSYAEYYPVIKDDQGKPVGWASPIYSGSGKEFSVKADEDWIFLLVANQLSGTDATSILRVEPVSQEPEIQSILAMLAVCRRFVALWQDGKTEEAAALVVEPARKQFVAQMIKKKIELKTFDDVRVFKHKDRLLGRVHITVAPTQGMGIDMEFQDGKWWITAR